MRPLGFLALLAVTALSAAGAGYALVSATLATAPTADYGRPLFPDLAGRANEATTVTVESAGAKVTLQRSDSGWGIAEKGGYPVATARVAKLVAGVAAVRLIEAKTAQPERYARLQVENLDQADAKSIRVTINDNAGQPLAAVLLGKPNYTLGGGASGLYVRQVGEAQSWLAEGSVEAPKQAVDWVERTLLDLPADEVKQIVYTPAEGLALTVAVSDPATAGYSLTPLPEGRSGDPTAVSGLTSLFGALQFDDVRPDKDAPPPIEAVETSSVGGLTLRAELVELDSEIWARLIASGSGDAAAKAAAVTKTTTGWLYKLPGHKMASFRPKLEDLLQPVPEPAPEPTTTP